MQSFWLRIVLIVFTATIRYTRPGPGGVLVLIAFGGCLSFFHNRHVIHAVDISHSSVNDETLRWT